MTENQNNETNTLLPEGNEVIFSIDKTRDWFVFTLRKWPIVLLFSFAGIIAGVFYAKRQPVMYESYLTFSLDDKGESGGGGIASIAAQFGLGSNDNNLFSGDNIIELIKSRKIIEAVLLSVDTFNKKQSTFINYLINLQYQKSSKDINFPVGITKDELNYEQNSIMYRIYNDIINTSLNTARPDKQLNIYFVKFKSPEENFTKKFTDRILSETIKFYTELRTKKSESTLKILESRVASIKGNMDAVISERAGTIDANVNPAFAQAQVPLQKQQLNMQVYSGAYEALYKNLELARFQYLQDIPLLQIIDKADFPMLKIVSSSVKSGALGGAICMLIIIFSLTLFFIFNKKA